MGQKGTEGMDKELDDTSGEGGGESQDGGSGLERGGRKY